MTRPLPTALFTLFSAALLLAGLSTAEAQFKRQDTINQEQLAWVR